jgi:hypothetical protein
MVYQILRINYDLMVHVDQQNLKRFYRFLSMRMLMQKEEEVEVEEDLNDDIIGD